jgi:beta-glucanase (GH16 family)
VKRKLLYIATFLFFAACSHTSNIYKKGYTLVWSDEFNGSAVDTSIWTYAIGGHGWGNHEEQFYTANNAITDNGNLVITAKMQNAGNNHFTSSRLITKAKKEFKYGRIEARAKIPVGQGFWPAFWTLGSDIDVNGWPRCGEIDIMEHINSSNVFYGTAHWDNNGQQSKGDSIIVPNSGFHVYAIEWDESSIQWFLDGVKYHELAIKNDANSTAEFHQPHFILLNLAIGGDWPGHAIDTALMPAKYVVDYVRVFQRK